MKSHKPVSASLCLAGLAIIAMNAGAGPIGTAFTYQAHLTDAGAPANGSYDLRFCVYNDVAAGTQVGGTITNLATAVSNGVFVVVLDFGAGSFDGTGRWLEVGVRKGTNDFTVLSPRQQVTPAPYAITAENLSGSLSASQLPQGVALLYADQTLTGSNAFSGVVTANNAANVFGGSFRGDGAGLTNLDTSVVVAATNDLNTALSAGVVGATNALWIASASLVATATNDLNTALSAGVVGATNVLWIASTNLVATATNDLNTALSAKIEAATNATWTATTNWVASQGYQVTNGLTRKAIISPAPANGTNYVVDFSWEVVQLTATNDIALVQSTNHPGAGWYAECVWYIQGGISNRNLVVNTNWTPVGSLATNTPYVIASNKLTIVAFSVRGGDETNVVYAVARQE